MAGRGRGRVLPAWMTSGKHAEALTAAAAAAKANSGGDASNPAAAVTPAGGVPGNLSSTSPSSSATTAVPGVDGTKTDMPPPVKKVATQGGYVANPRARPKPLPARPKSVGGWAEHKTVEGKVYYFNSITGQSQFVKPDLLKSEVEKALPDCVWKQFIKDGKSYYFNQQTQASVWDQPMAFTTFKERLRSLCEGDTPTKDTFSMERNRVARLALAECVVNLDGPTPEEIAAAAAAAEKEGGEGEEGSEAAAEAEKTAAETAGASSAARLMADLKTVSGDLKATVSDDANKKQYKNMEEAKEAFKQMLNDKKVSPDAKWTEAMAKGIANDKRFRALKTMAQRKQALEEYKNWKLKADKEAERLKREKRESDFTALLTESTTAGLINGRMRVPDAEPVLCEDPRYIAFSERPKDRDALLDEYLYKLYQTGKAERELKRTEALAGLDVLLNELSKEGKITHESRWSQVEPMLDALNDTRVEAVEAAADRETAVRAFVRVLADQARQLRRKLEEEHKEQIRVRRRAFGDWLKVALRKGLLPLDAPWESLVTASTTTDTAIAPVATTTTTNTKEEDLAAFVEVFDMVDFNREPTYTSLIEIPGAGVFAKEEYVDACRALATVVTPCRRSLRDVLRARGFAVQNSSSFEDLCRFLDPVAADKAVVIVSKPPVAETEAEGEGEKGTIENSSRFSVALFMDVSANLLSVIAEYGGAVSVTAFGQLVQQAKDEERREKKKLRRKQENFIDMLEDFIFKTEHAGLTWETAKPKFAKEEEYLELGTDDMRAPLFEKFMVSFRARKEKKRKAFIAASTGATEGEATAGAASAVEVSSTAGAAVAALSPAVGSNGVSKDVSMTHQVPEEAGELPDDGEIMEGDKYRDEDKDNKRGRKERSHKHGKKSKRRKHDRRSRSASASSERRRR